MVTIYDSGEADGLLYIAMRLVDGTTLAERLRGSSLWAEETTSILGPIAGALDAAHAIGLVHRDVQPQNILLDSRGHPYLTDFGVAAANGPALPLTGSDGFAGSVDYCAPEQIAGELPRATADVYSLTAVLYECLTGEVPYPRDTDDDVMRAHLHERPPRLLSLSSVAAELNRVIARGMAKRPRSRYATAGELMQDAAALIDRMAASRRRARPAFPANVGSDAELLAPTRRGDYWTDALERADWLRAPALADPGCVPPRKRGLGGGAGKLVVGGGRRRAGGARASGPGEVLDAARDRDDRRGDSDRDRRGRGASVRARTGVVAQEGGGIHAQGGGILAQEGGGIFPREGGRTATRVAVSPPEVASNGLLTMSFRAPWRRSSSPGLGGLALQDPILLRASQASLAAGLLARSSSIPAGPPPSLESRFGTPSTQSTVLIAGRPARRYGWSVAGGEQVVAQVLATTAADISIVCAAPAAATGEMASCLALAAPGEGGRRCAPSAAGDAGGHKRAARGGAQTGPLRASPGGRAQGDSAPPPRRDRTCARACGSAKRRTARHRRHPVTRSAPRGGRRRRSARGVPRTLGPCCGQRRGRSRGLRRVAIASAVNGL